MSERPILFNAPMVRALLACTKRKKLYAPPGADPTDPEHLARRLANGIAINERTGCWEWRRTTNGDGYGMLRVAGKMVYAHRLSYELGVGPIPAGLHILHRCDNPRCINPEHLSAGTRSQNMKECSERGRARIPKTIKRGEDNGAAKLGGAEVRSIRRLLSAGLTQREIAARFGVSQQTISGIKAGKRWGHVE